MVNLVENLLAKVTEVNAEFAQIKSDNAVLKIQICKLRDILSTNSCHMEAAAGTTSSKSGVMSYQDVIASNQHPSARNTSTSKGSRNLIISIQKPTAANAAAEVRAVEIMDSTDVTTSPGNPAENGFIRMIKKETWRC